MTTWQFWLAFGLGWLWAYVLAVIVLGIKIRSTRRQLARVFDNSRYGKTDAVSAYPPEFFNPEGGDEDGPSEHN